MLYVFTSRVYSGPEGTVVSVESMGDGDMDDVRTMRHAVPRPGMTVFSYWRSKFETYALFEKTTFRASVIPLGVWSAVKPFVLDVGGVVPASSPDIRSIRITGVRV